MLTRTTRIPTAVRGKVRALVKAHKWWPVFLRKEGMISANAKNADLIRYALFYPELAAQIEALMGLAPAASVSAGIDTRAIEELATEVEALLRKAGRRAADEYKARRQVLRV